MFLIIYIFMFILNILKNQNFFIFFLSFDGQCLHCVCDTTNLRVLIITRRRVRKRRPLRYHSIHGIGLPSTRHDNVILCLAIISKRSLLLCAIRAGLAIIIIIMKESRKKNKNKNYRLAQKPLHNHSLII